MRAKEAALHQNTIVVDGHNHLMMELAKRRNRGDRAVFTDYYAPLIRNAGVNVISLVVGGDNTCLTNDSDLMLWGSLWAVDMLWEEAEESNDSISICLTSKDIDRAIDQDIIALLLTMEGGRPVEGKPNLETLVGLRTFYKLGLRCLQIVDNGRNRIGDGKGEIRTKGGLTNFGISVVEEMNHLGMIIDVAHLTEPGFWDVIETSKDPIIDSHSNAKSVCDHPRNLTDDQIKSIAEKGGVIGLSCNTALVNKDKEKPTIEDLRAHVDYISDLVGIEHVALGPDIIEFELDCNIWTPAPGWLEGVFYGEKDTYLIEGFNTMAGFPTFTAELLNQGYSEVNVRKVMGENWLRVYKQVIG